MRRINFFALVTLMLGALVLVFSVPDIKNSGSFSVAAPQAPRTSLRRIAVNTRTIATLPAGKNYVVDLTQHGVKYEFDPKAGKINLTRVLVRTATGEVPIGRFLEKTFLKAELTGFKYTSQAFSIATLPARTTQTRAASTGNFHCGEEVCTCIGDDDCDNMGDSLACAGKFFCAKNPITGQVVCSCQIARRPQ